MTAVQSSIDAVRVAAVAADRMKAADIEAFDVSDLLAITDIMMVATAMNERQVIGVAEEVEKDVYLKCGHLSPRSREGRRRRTVGAAGLRRFHHPHHASGRARVLSPRTAVA